MECEQSMKRNPTLSTLSSTTTKLLLLNKSMVSNCTEYTKRQADYEGNNKRIKLSCTEFGCNNCTESGYPQRGAPPVAGTGTAAAVCSNFWCPCGYSHGCCCSFGTDSGAAPIGPPTGGGGAVAGGTGGAGGPNGKPDSGDKKDEVDDEDYDERTLSFLKIFAPDLYDSIQMKRLIKRDIILDRPNVLWTDIANQSKAKQLLKETIVLPLEKPTYFQGIRKPWKGILLVGPPGTGKTMLAKAVATEKGTTFFNINISTLTSKYFGESEKLVKLLFDEAKARAPSVIFIDEIDSLCSTRGKAAEHECTRRMKSELLCHMDGISSATNADPTKSVVILGATNFPWNLDEAFLRRLEKRIYVPLPDSKGRKELLELVLKDVDVEESVDLELLADKLDGYSSADIVIVCRDAAFMCMREAIRGKSVAEIQQMSMATLKKPITADDFERAIEKCQKTVTLGDIKKFEEWDQTFGSFV